MKNVMCKRIIATALAFIMVFGASPAAGLAGLSDFFGSLTVSAAVGTWGDETAASLSGAGTESDPYIINTAAQLAFLAASVNSGTSYSGKSIRLTSDITLNSSDMFARNENGVITGAAEGKTPQSWTAIGTSSKCFYGIFDGNGHTVSGIYIDTASDYQGLFGYSQGTIKNLGIIDSYISGGSKVGGVVGCITSSGTVTNSYNTGTVSGNNSVGGVSGNNFGTSMATPYIAGTVSGDSNVGGVVGDDTSSCTVTNSYNAGMVSGNSSVGGVVGDKKDGTVTNSYYLTGTASFGIGESSSNTGAAPLTDAQMKTQGSFAGWDFSAVWTMDGDPDYQYPELLFLSDDSIHVTDVNISRTTLTVDVGSESQLSATVIPSNATDQAVTWKSSNTAVATVSSSGLVTAKAAGAATITVTTIDGGYTDICEVTVVHVIPVELSKIEIQSLPTKLSYYKGDTLNTAGLAIELTYNSGSKETKTSGFTCSPTTLNTLGTQTITVTYGGKSCTFSVRVNNSISPTGIKLSATSMNLDYKSSGSLTATVSPTDATNKTVEWTSSDPKVADVDKSSGKVTATGNGTATITAKIVGTDISASCTVTVKYTFLQWLIIILLFGWLWY